MSTDININSINAVTRRRAAIITDEGPVELNTHTIGEWLHRMKKNMKDADQHAQFGYEDQALKALVKVLALGVLCLDEHLEADEEQLPFGAIPLNPPSKGDKIPMDLLVLIARYELYADLEMNGVTSITEQFVDHLAEDDQQLMDRYLNAKIQAIGFETGNVSVAVNKNADAADTAPAQ